MTVTKKAEGTSATLVVEGRVDTTTAPDLDREVESLGDIKDLTIDFTGVEYISSAGLRVLLKAQKMMTGKGTMKITNAIDSVKEIFDITGFSDILTIE